MVLWVLLVHSLGLFVIFGCDAPSIVGFYLNPRAIKKIVAKLDRLANDYQCSTMVFYDGMHLCRFLCRFTCIDAKEGLQFN